MHSLNLQSVDVHSHSLSTFQSYVVKVQLCMPEAITYVHLMRRSLLSFILGRDACLTIMSKPLAQKDGQALWVAHDVNCAWKPASKTVIDAHQQALYHNIRNYSRLCLGLGCSSILVFPAVRFTISPWVA